MSYEHEIFLDEKRHVVVLKTTRHIGKIAFVVSSEIPYSMIFCVKKNEQILHFEKTKQIQEAIIEERVKLFSGEDGT